MITRRIALAGLAGISVAGLATRAQPQAARPSSPRDNFKITGTFLNAAYTHPLPLDSAAAAQRYLAWRCDPGGLAENRHLANGLFARLVNAKPNEIAGIPSTSYGESFVAGALGLFDDRKAKVVTDILHYDGALYMYGELAKLGTPVTTLAMSPDGRIDMNALERAVDSDTRLVAISLVSWLNGFQHDLKTVCEIAHRKGARVFVDAIQGAGAVPLDVKASGVDFVACASFKWLQGDFGYGFLYVREDLLPILKRPAYGYHQPKTFEYHVLPGDPPGEKLFEATPDDTKAAGFFEVGSLGAAAEVAVSVSLQNLINMGVANIQRTRQPLMDRLYEKLSTKYRPLTPKGSTSPIIAFSLPDADKVLKPKLREAGINIQLYRNRFRISPSIYNTMHDVDELIGVLT